MARRALGCGGLSRFRSFLLIKGLTSGSFFRGDIPQLARRANINERTLRRHLEWLISHKWMGRSKNREKYYVRSWKDLCKTLDIKPRRSVRVTLRNLKSNRQLRAHLVAAVLEFMMLPHGDRRKPVLRKSRTNQASPHRWGISCALLGKFLGVSKTKAWMLRKHSGENGFIRLFPNDICTNMVAAFLEDLRETNPDSHYYLKDGMVYQRCTFALRVDRRRVRLVRRKFR